MLQDILTARKGQFDPGVHTELRGQLNRQRRVVLLSGNVVANARADVSGVSARVWRSIPRRRPGRYWRPQRRTPRSWTPTSPPGNRPCPP